MGRDENRDEDAKMTDVRAIVLRAAGTNCDVETQHALELAGARVDRVHINTLIRNLELVDAYQIFVIPGGFSYGDNVAAGKILANQVVHHLREALKRFVEQGKLVLGICNGFQVLVKAGLLPGATASSDTQEGVTITYNDSDKFENRWVYLAPRTDRCVFVEPARRLYLTVGHGEGKVVAQDPSVLSRLQSTRHIAFQYVDAHGREGGYPVNPNGSMASIAGLTDATGLILGLMPHPERFVHPTQHPRWTRMKGNVECDGRTIFDNAVKYVKGHF